jgi:hypothetical protein
MSIGLRLRNRHTHFLRQDFNQRSRKVRLHLEGRNGRIHLEPSPLFIPSTRAHQFRHPLLVDPGVGSRSVGGDLISGKPEGDLLLGALNGVASVDDVTEEMSWITNTKPANMDAVISTDSAGGRICGAGLTEHLAASCDNTKTFPDLMIRIQQLAFLPLRQRVRKPCTQQVRERRAWWPGPSSAGRGARERPDLL